MKIAGSKIVLTGASGGLGHAIARTLAAQGAQLVLTARREAQLQELADEIGAEILVADLADRADVARVAEAARNADVLIANAGVGGGAAITNETDDEVDFIIDVNLRSPIVLSNAFAQAHISAGTQGQIVLVGSLAGLVASPNTRMYNATKFGLRGYALSLRQDLEPYGIGVTLVAPGFIRDAGMFAENDIDLPKGVRTKSPDDVGAGVAKAITANPPEVFVSPVELRLSATFGTVAPGVSATIQRWIGAAEMNPGK